MGKYGIIYIATSPSGKSYIGQTIESLNERKRKHLINAKAIDSSGKHKYDYKFPRAIRKYGNRLKWKILYDNVPENQLGSIEKWVIANYDTFNNGYNSTLGGNSPMSGRKHTVAACQKISKAEIGNKKSTKLTWKEVREIREKYETGNYLYKQLAREHDINYTNISYIINNKTWKERELIN